METEAEEEVSQEQCMLCAAENVFVLALHDNQRLDSALFALTDDAH
jgi:hypothetical protein